MSIEERKTIGQKLREYREAADLTQKGLAEGICTHTSISEMEKGTFVLKEDKLIKVCAKLGIKVEDLLEGHGAEVKAEIMLGIVKIQIEREDYPAAYKVIEEMEASGKLEEGEKWSLVIYKSDCLMRTGKADQSIAILSELQLEMEQRNNVDLHVLANMYNHLGNAHFFASYIVDAHKFYWRAYDISLRFPVMGELAAKIAFNMGKVYGLMGNTKFAYEFYSIAEKYFIGASDTKRIAQVLFEQGIVYVKQKEWEKAQSSLAESFALYKSLNLWKMVLRVREVIALSVLAEQYPSLAVKELVDCAKEFEKIDDVKRASFSYACAANVLIDQEQSSDATKYMEFAMKYPTEILSPKLAYIYRVKAKYLLAVKSYCESVEYSSKSATLFAKMGLERESAESLKQTVQSYRRQELFQQAFDISDQIIEKLSKSLYGKFQS